MTLGAKWNSNLTTLFIPAIYITINYSIREITPNKNYVVWID